MLAIVKTCKKWQCYVKAYKEKQHYVKDAIHQIYVITNHVNLQRYFVDK